MPEKLNSDVYGKKKESCSVLLEINLERRSQDALLLPCGIIVDDGDKNMI